MSWKHSVFFRISYPHITYLEYAADSKKCCIPVILYIYITMHKQCNCTNCFATGFVIFVSFMKFCCNKEWMCLMVMKFFLTYVLWIIICSRFCWICIILFIFNNTRVKQIFQSILYKNLIPKLFWMCSKIDNFFQPFS